MTRPASQTEAFGPACALAVVVLLMGCGSSGGASSGYPPGGGGRGGQAGAASGLGGASGQPQGGAGGRSSIGTGGVGAGGRAGTGGAAGSSSAAGGRSGSGGYGGASAGCFLSIQAIAPATSFQIEAGPGVVMRVQGVALGTAATLTWSWTVNYADGNGTKIETTPVALDKAPPGTVVEFPVEKPGMYQIVASVTGDVRCSITTQVLTAIASTGLSFTFRTTTDQYPVQETPVKLPSDPVQHVLSLTQGQAVALAPLDVTYGLLLPSYVRITSPSTSFGIEGDTTRTPLSAVLLPYLNYDVLIVPDGAFAPLLLSLNPVTGWWKPAVDPGIGLLVRTLAAGGGPVANARMLLKRGVVPSTLGTSDASGVLAVLARPGSLTATVVPPDGSGLPVATTKDPFELTATGLPALTMQWDDFPAGTLAVQVVRPDGVTPVGNAQVWLSSAPPSYRAGVLTIGASSVLEATASVAFSVVTDDEGRAVFPPCPTGPYAVTAIPPGSAAPSAVTTVPTVVSVGPVSQTITLASKVALTGILLPLPASAGALIRAVDTGTAATYADPGTPATGTTVSGQAANDGSFSLSVDPERTYELIIQPIPNAAASVGRSVVRVSSPGAAQTNLGVITLPAGQLYQGTVMLMDTTPRTVPGAFIQVYCVPSAIGCVDPAVSLAEATSRGDGSFSVVLPQAAATVTSALLAR